MTNTNCYIIGVLDNAVQGLTYEALDTIRLADVVIGGKRTLELFKTEFSDQVQSYDLTGQLGKVPQWVEWATSKQKKVVVLATGDPLCHGIASFLLSKLVDIQCKIIPNVSTMQLACARLGQSSQDIAICSVHTKDTGEWFTGAEPSHGLYQLMHLLKQGKTVAVFTSPQNTPARIARMLQAEGLEKDYCVSVVADILQKNEAVYKRLSVDDVAQKEFSELNITILHPLQEHSTNIVFGLPDNSFIQRKPEKGLITKREVRAVSLAHLQLNHNSIVWDIGAGSGSVGLEAAQLCFNGHVYAIEKNAADYENALINKKAMAIVNYTLVHDKAPAAMDDWPAPDAVFIGGSGGELNRLIKLSLQCLNSRGCLVMNFVTLENMASAIQCLKELDAKWSYIQINIARSQPILDMHRLAAENPVWIVTASRKMNEKNNGV